MKFRRDVPAAHPAVAGPRRRRARSAFLNLLLEGAGLADTFDERQDVADELREWADRADELAECAELLASGGYTDHASPLPLRPGEQVFLVVPDAALVESLSIDLGTVTVTNVRVVFQSTTQAQQLVYTKLRSCRHDESEPITYFDVEDATLGIRYEPAMSFRFRMRLAVARAWADDDRDALRPALQTELAEHLARRPVALPVR